MSDCQPKNAAARADYVTRINRVQDHIEAHLDEALPLEELARVACFSPFHFHRIFGAMVGEPLHRFIRRLRLERAAAQLVMRAEDPVTAVALDAGFGSSATFARAFKAHFGMSASDWRAGGHRLRKNGITDRKDGQPPRNPGIDVEVSSPYREERNPNWKWRIRMKGDSKLEAVVEVKDLPPMHVAYVRHTGPYAGNAELFEGLFGRLMTWAGPRGLIQPPATQVLCVYHDHPEVTEEDKLRVSACITVPEDTPVDGEIGKMTVQGGRYAVARFEVGPTEYADAWQAVYGGWLPESGFLPDDRPAFELYGSDPKEHPERKQIVDICVAVRPA